MLQDVICVADGAEWGEEKAEAPLPLQEREATQVMAIQCQAVEKDPGYRHALHGAFDVVRICEPHATLKPLEAWFAPLIQSDDLAVDEEAVHRQSREGPDQFWVAPRNYLATPSVELCSVSLPKGHDPNAVILDLEEPLLT